MIDWLLEQDDENPGVRYFALTDLFARPGDDPEVVQAQRTVMSTGPVPAMLGAQGPEGFWLQEGTGYSPKYRSTVWQILVLAQLGANPQDERVQRGYAHLLDHAIAKNGAFPASNPARPTSAIPCLNGNLLYGSRRLGWAMIHAWRPPWIGRPGR